MDNQARLAELQAAIIDRDDQIHQLRMELQGAVEAVQAAQAQPLRYQLPQPVGGTEAILKSLQTPQIIRDIGSFDVPPKPNYLPPNLFQPSARLLQPPPRYQPPPRPHPSAFQPRPFQPMPRFFNPLQPPPRYQPLPRPHPSAFHPRPFQPMPRSFNPQPKPTPMDVDPSIRSRHVNYLNRPNYQLEQECYWYYPQDPSLHLYSEHSDPVNSAEIEQQQPDQIYTYTAEATTSEPSSADVPQDETDDLNFQAVTRLLPLT
ncbi:uncharacterized protein LOC129760158 [Uranotaenia lowii]|uniref:uncharacterized protein LOC129760158 n=1 Tax=Uranotaenia lowii TaxID=190385 RepID=UPI00247A3CB5|nr:uncharacterized protein LOC129760158 [Uranotaenia lowii]